MSRCTLPLAFVVLCVLRSVAYAQSTINMSHDLVTLGIAAQNLTPDRPQLDAMPLFQATINYASAHGGVSLITVDPGAYYLLTRDFPGAYLYGANLSDLTVDLAGSTVWLADAMSEGFYFAYCTRLTLRNFQLDFLSLPFTQVQLTSVDTSGRRLLYSALPNWPDPVLLNNVMDVRDAILPDIWALAFRNGRIVPGTSRFSVTRPMTEGVLTLIQDFAPWTQAPTLGTLQPGDVIAVTLRSVAGAPIHAFHGDSIVFSDIAVYGSASMAVQLDYVTNSVVDHVSVMPRPGTDRLIGSNADGIHFLWAGQSSAIRNCFVTRTMDDAIAMDSEFVGVIQSQLGPRQLRVSRADSTRFPNGTPVNFVDRTSTLESIGGVIVDQSPPDSDVPLFDGTVDITLDRDVTVAAESMMVYGSDALRGAGSVIEDNTVVDGLFSRGIWVGGAHGITVRRNVIDTVAMSGIEIFDHDVNASDQGPPSNSIAVDSNVVRNPLGPMASGWQTQAALGGIEVGYMDSLFALGPNATHSNVTITSNYVGDSGRAGIWIGEVAGALAQNNLVVRWNREPTLPFFGVNSTDEANLIREGSLQPVAVQFSTDAHLVSNVTAVNSPVTQAVSLNPESQSLSEAAFVGALAVTPNVAAFNWKAVSDSAWLTVTGNAIGTGFGSVSYSASANDTGAARTGNITIAGVVFQVTQSATGVAGPVITMQPINVTIENGQRASFTVFAIGKPLFHYAWQLSSDGRAWTNLTDTAPYEGSGTSTLTIVSVLPSLTGSRYRCVISNPDGSTTSLPATLTVPVLAPFAIDHPSLNFGATVSSSGFTAWTAAQTVLMTQSGFPGPVSWTAVSNEPWLTVSPASGTGSATLTVNVRFDPSLPPPPATVSGVITITLTGAANTVEAITVVLNTMAPSGAQPPFGAFDTPNDGTMGVAGSIAVTGWSLDLVQVTRVTVCRDPVAREPVPANGNCAGNYQIYIGDAVFIDGARPDVQGFFPMLPLSSRGGWGYLMLTNFLPNQGNGKFTLSAYAFDAEGHNTLLGVKTITCNNAGSFAPFGAIDVPGQGAITSGVVGNTGWVLAQDPNFADPPDLGVVNVFVDGTNVGSPGLWNARPDLTALFPAAQYPGISQALGIFGLDTTTLTNGVHTIFWLVTGTGQSGTSGIGSRFFSVSNGAELVTPAAVTQSSPAATVIASRSTLDIPAAAASRIVSGERLASEIAAVPLDRNTVLGRRGFDLELQLQTYPSSAGAIDVQAEELDRVELHLGTAGQHQYTGYLQTAAGLKPLPVGSSLDASTGTFVWMPGVGFYGTYHLTFVRWSGANAVARQDVRITLNAKGSNRIGPQTIIDAPRAGASIGLPFFVGGWAADLDSTVDTGVNTVHVWAYPIDAHENRLDPIFIGPAIYGGARPDVAAVYGDRFGDSGYGIIVNGLAPGTYDIAVFAFSTVVNNFTPATVVRVTVR